MRRIVPLAAALLAAVACSSSAAHRGDGAVDVTISVSGCGTGWHGGAAGAQNFVLRNTDTRSGEVALIDPSSGAVFAEVEPLGPGTHTTLHADLGSGHYAFRCAMEDEPAITGPTVVLAGHVRGGTPGVPPVAQGDLLTATRAYEQYVAGRMPGLLRQVTAIRADLAAGRLGSARRDWLPAQLDYLRLGAAYGEFGDLDAAIDGRASGLPRTVRDPRWQGLHHIEYGLWHGQTAASLLPAATGLVASVAQLEHTLPSRELDPADLSIRAHEITEDAVEFPLTGRDDYGAHAGLAYVQADLAATRTVLDVLHALLAPRYAGLPHTLAWLDRTAHDVARAGSGDPLLLPRGTRERVDSDVAQLAELLAPVASILEPRRTS